MARRFFSKKRQRRETRRQFREVSGRVERQGRAAGDAGLQRSLDFDARDAVSDFGGGFLDEAREGLEQDFGSLVGNAVGRGRLRTGFFQRDAGRLFQDFNRRVSNAIASQSLEASRLNLQNIQGLQRSGSDLLGQQVDLIGGAFDRETAEENANAGGGFGGFVAKGLGAVAGSVLPGVGTAVGAALGDKVSGFFRNRQAA